MALEVPGYHLRGCLARSGVASVHRAEAVGRPGRLLVVKHLPAPPDPATLTAVRHVAEVLGGLDHPNVLPLLEVVDTGAGIALVMPFTPGGSLAGAIAGAPAGLPPAMIAEVGTRIADGLAAIHEHGLVHGAITARSVRFDARGRPLLADTGTALLSGGAPPRTVPPSRDRPSRAAAHDAAGDLRALEAVLAAAVARADADADTDTDGAADRAGGTAAACGSVPTPGPGGPLVDDGVAPRVRAAIAGPGHDVVEAGRRSGRWRRVALVAAAALVLLVPVVLVATAVEDRAPVVASPGPTPSDPPGHAEVPDAPTPAAGLEPDPPDAPPTTAPEPAAPAAPDASDAAPAGPDTVRLRPRRPPPLCPGLDPPPGDGAVLLADLDGLGCSTPVRWDGRELTATTSRATPHRYELLVDGGDQLLFGDLHCDGRDAPVLYRPRTGEVFVFDGLVAPGEEITVTGEPSGRLGGRATIVTDDTGCDRLRVDEQR